MWKENNNKLQKVFKFKDFKESWAFMNRVAVLADEYNHHPWWSNEYNIVEIHLTTHDAGNKITEKDRDLASSIDMLYKKIPI